MTAPRPRTLAELQRWRRTRAKRRWYKRSFRLQVMMLVGLLLAGMLLAQGTYLNHRKAEIITHQMGERALAVAKTVAGMPQIVNAFSSPDPSAIIQPLAERVRQETGARYVVVGNAQSIRYSHPVPERIGQPMVGGDNDQALIYGQSYVSEATGALGTAMRGKTPVWDEEGNIIGVVSVGFMLDRVDMDVARYTSLGWALVAADDCAGVCGRLLAVAALEKDHFRAGALRNRPLGNGERGHPAIDSRRHSRGEPGWPYHPGEPAGAALFRAARRACAAGSADP